MARIIELVQVVLIFRFKIKIKRDLEIFEEQKLYLEHIRLFELINVRISFLHFVEIYCRSME